MLIKKVSLFYPKIIVIVLPVSKVALNENQEFRQLPSPPPKGKLMFRNAFSNDFTNMVYILTFIESHSYETLFLCTITK